MTRRSARSGPRRPGGLHVWIAVVMFTGGLIAPGAAGVEAQASDSVDAACADPAAWAVANGAKLIDRSKSDAGSSSVVTFALFGGPVAVIGSPGRDVVFGSRRDDLVCAGDGADLIWSGNGDDLVDGGLGADVIVAGNSASSADRCRVDATDVVVGCDVVSEASEVFPPADVRIAVNDRLVEDSSGAPVVPRISCVRERGDGLVDAVIGHTTFDPEVSLVGTFSTIDDVGAQIVGSPLPRFFFRGDHDHTVIVPYDPSNPARLRLGVSTSQLGPSAPLLRWRFDIQLGAGPPPCGPDVPQVVPFVEFGAFSSEFVGSFAAGPSFAPDHFFRVAVESETVCTGALSTPLEPEVELLFSDKSGLAPLSAGQTVATFEEGWVQANTMVRRFLGRGNGTFNAQVKLAAEGFGRCELSDGSVLRSTTPTWDLMDGNNGPQLNATVVANDMGSTYSDLVFFPGGSGFSRFR